MKMADKLSMYSATNSTVYCWTPGTPNRTFSSLEKAVEYVSEHIDQIATLEVFVHGDDGPELIDDRELAKLVKILRATH